MMKTRILGAILAVSLLAGCEGTVNAKLDNSIGLATYQNLGLIEKKPLGIGLVVPEEFRTATTEVVTHNIRFKMSVGEALAARLMYALVLQFDRVQYLEQPAFPSSGDLDAIMVVTLKDLDATVDIAPKWNTVATESSGWIEIEALLKNRANEIVWVGTSRSEAQATEESIMVAGAQDAGAAMNQAIEATVAKLVAQMGASTSLRDFITARDQGL